MMSRQVEPSGPTPAMCVRHPAGNVVFRPNSAATLSYCSLVMFGVSESTTIIGPPRSSSVNRRRPHCSPSGDDRRTVVTATPLDAVVTGGRAISSIGALIETKEV
jgi:hypothetical protein